MSHRRIAIVLVCAALVVFHALSVQGQTTPGRISGTVRVIRLIAGHSGDAHAAHTHLSPAVIADARNQIAYFQGHVLVISRPQLDRLRCEHDDGWLRVFYCYFEVASWTS